MHLCFENLYCTVPAPKPATASSATALSVKNYEATGATYRSLIVIHCFATILESLVEKEVLNRLNLKLLSMYVGKILFETPKQDVDEVLRPKEE